MRSAPGADSLSIFQAVRMQRQNMGTFYARLRGNRFDNLVVPLGAMITEGQKQPAARLWLINRLLF